MTATFESLDDMINYGKSMDGFAFQMLDKNETIFREPQEKAFKLSSVSGLSIVIDMISSYEFFYKVFDPNGEILFETNSSQECSKIADWDRILNVDTLVSDLICKFKQALSRIKREISMNERNYQRTRKDQYCYRVTALERQYHATERAINRLTTKNANIQ